MAEPPLSGFACRTNTTQSDCSNDPESISVTNNSIAGAHLSTTNNYLGSTVGSRTTQATVTGRAAGRNRATAVRYANLEAATASPVLTKPNRTVNIETKVNSSETIVGVFGSMQGWRKTMEDRHIMAFPMLDPPHQGITVPKLSYHRLGSGNSHQIPSHPFACTISSGSSPRFVNFAVGTTGIQHHDEEYAIESSATYPGRRTSNQSALDPILAIPAHSEVQSTASSPRGGVSNAAFLNTLGQTNNSQNAFNHPHRNSTATASGSGYDPNSFAVFGVFDGHRGADAAAFASTGLAVRLGPVLKATTAFAESEEGSLQRKGSGREQIESLAIGKKSPLAVDDYVTERFIVDAFEDTDISLREEHERQVQARGSVNQSPENPNQSQQSSPGGSPSFRHRGSEGLDTPPPIPLTTASPTGTAKASTQSPNKVFQLVSVPNSGSATTEGSPSPLKFSQYDDDNHRREEADPTSRFPPMSAASSAAPTPRASTNIPTNTRSSPHNSTCGAQSQNPPIGLQGSTAHVVLLTSDRYFFCNVGDSRGYLITRRPLDDAQGVLSGAQSPNSPLMGSEASHEGGNGTNSPHGSFRTTSPPHIPCLVAQPAPRRRTSQPHTQVTLMVDESAHTTTNSFASADVEAPAPIRPKRHSVITATSSANTTNAQSPSLGPNVASPLTSNHDSPERPSSVALGLEDKATPCVLPFKLSVHSMSTDHRTANEAEKARVLAAGGFVVNNRVNSKLSVTRAFGDIDLKPHPPAGLSTAEFAGSLPSFGIIPTTSYAPSLANSFAYSQGEVSARLRFTSSIGGEQTPSSGPPPNPIIVTPEVRVVARTASPPAASREHKRHQEPTTPVPLDTTSGCLSSEPQSPTSPDSPNSVLEDSKRPISFDIVLVGCDGVWELETAESIGKRMVLAVEMVFDKFFAPTSQSKLMSETCESNAADVEAAMSGLAELVAAAGQPSEFTGSTLNATMLNTLNTLGSAQNSTNSSPLATTLVDALKDAVADTLNRCCNINCDPKGTTPGTDNLSLGVVVVFPPERLANHLEEENSAH